MAMSLVALFKFANGAVASFSPYATVLFWLITMAASARLYRSARRVSLPFVLLLSFTLVAGVLSAVVSKAPDVSVMKVVSFFIVSSAMLLASQVLRDSEVWSLQRWFFSIALVMANLLAADHSVPCGRIPDGADGLAGHVQPPAGGGGLFRAVRLVVHREDLPGPIPLPAAVAAGIAVLFAGLIVASGARTAMFATFVSVALTLVIVLVKGRTGPTARSRDEILGFTFVLCAMSLVLILTGALKEELQSVVFKGDDTENIDEAFASSRGAGMAQQIQNFLDAPLTGHGFGVYREGVRGGEAGVKRFLGIPISASAEKGIVFTSVLEEVGIVGALLFYALLVAIVAAVAKGPSAGALAMVIGSIAVNFGEAVIFSTGGIGLFMWLIIGFGLARARVPVDATGSADPAAIPASFPSNIMR